MLFKLYCHSLMEVIIIFLTNLCQKITRKHFSPNYGTSPIPFVEKWEPMNFVTTFWDSFSINTYQSECICLPMSSYRPKNLPYARAHFRTSLFSDASAMPLCPSAFFLVSARCAITSAVCSFTLSALCSNSAMSRLIFLIASSLFLLPSSFLFRYSFLTPSLTCLSPSFFFFVASVLTSSSPLLSLLSSSFLPSSCRHFDSSQQGP